MKLIDKLKYRLKTITKFDSLIIYRPAMVNIGDNARINIRNEFAFNKQWNWQRQAENQEVGTIIVEDDAVLDVDRFWGFAGSTVGVYKGAKLKLGTGYMNYKCNIHCFNSITIGNDVCISEGVVIRDSDNHYIHRDGYEMSAPIVIGNNVWIGLNAIILKGVTI